MHSPSPSPRSSPEPIIRQKLRPSSSRRGSLRSGVGSYGNFLAPPLPEVEEPHFTTNSRNVVVFSTIKTSNLGWQAHAGSEESARSEYQNLTIYSRSLVYALRSVIRYYSDAKLAAENPVFTWPYAELVHYYEDLKYYAANCGRLGDYHKCFTGPFVLRLFSYNATSAQTAVGKFWNLEYDGLSLARVQYQFQGKG